MDLKSSTEILQGIVVEARATLIDYANSNNIKLDEIDLSDRAIVESLVRSAGLRDSAMEDTVIEGIKVILDL